MKKLLSVLIAATMLLSFMALSASAANSFVGEITVSDKIFTTPEDSDFTGTVTDPETGKTTAANLRKFEYTDKATGEKKTINLHEHIEIIAHKVLVERNAAKTLSVLPLAAKNANWTSVKKIIGGLGEAYKSYSAYTAFEVTFSDEAKAALGKTVVETINVVFNVPGLNAVTSPTAVYFDDEADKYSIDSDATVNASELSLTVDFNPQHSAYYAIINTSAEKSPETGVNALTTVALVALFVVSLAGVAFAGKKAFSK